MNRLTLQTTCLLLFVLSIWAIGSISGCNDRQTMINGICCDLCPPGFHLEKFCSEVIQTVCKPCEEGYYADKYNIFNRCEKCQSCQQGYAEKCTQTTRGTCSCWSGFLCSNNLCSVCEKNKCMMWEKVTKTEAILSPGLKRYSYECEDKCPENQYFDAEDDTCKSRIRCSDSGLAERFPGNNSHNTICDMPEIQKDDQDSIHVILYISIALLSFTLVLSLFCNYSNNLRKCTADKKPIQATATKTGDSHLSQEESGLQVITQDKSQDCDISGELQLEKVSICISGELQLEKVSILS